MKNFEKYEHQISKVVNEDNTLTCSIAIVSGIKKQNMCSFDDDCNECSKECLKWMHSEYKEQILTEEEKDIIRHFMEAYSGICSKIVKVIKTGSFNVVCLKFLSGSTSSICSVNCVTISPEISKDVMFKGMELNVAYTLEELGL